jgi:multimeric flavodoxin WrbA
MVSVLVIYYTRGGKTKRMADAIAEGAIAAGAEGSTKRVDYAIMTDLIDCDAVAFGSPNYFSYMAGDMKSFFDNGLSIRGKTEGKPAAAFTSGGGNSETALASLERMIGSYRLEKAVDGIIQSGELTDEVLIKCKEMGKALAEAAKKRTADPTE